MNTSELTEEVLKSFKEQETELLLIALSGTKKTKARFYIMAFPVETADLLFGLYCIGTAKYDRIERRFIELQWFDESDVSQTLQI